MSDQPFIRETAYHWLLGDRLPGCLPEGLLLLFGNSDLYRPEGILSPLEKVERIGGFFTGLYGGQPVAFTTPKFGAPIVAMLLEVAALAGVRRVVGIGYVGGLQPDVRIGDLFVPTRALSLDGTTAAYFGPRHESEPAAALAEELQRRASAAGVGVSHGTVVSIDALMLETAEQIQEWREAGYSAVDLETACLFAVGAHVGLSCAALHIVSDNQVIRDLDRERKHHVAREEQVTMGVEAVVALPDLA